MEYVGSISSMAVAGLAVWTLTRHIHTAFDDSGRSDWAPPSVARMRPEDFLGSRVMHLLSWFVSWLGVWVSAQTAVLVACGLAGVLLNWLVISGVVRLFSQPVAATTNGNQFPSSPQRNAGREDGCAGAAKLCL